MAIPIRGFADQRMAFSVLLPVKQKEFQLFSPDLNPAKAIFADLLFKTSVSPAEILSGLAIMADGRRRLDLEAAARSMLGFFDYRPENHHSRLRQPGHA